MRPLADPLGQMPSSPKADLNAAAVEHRISAALILEIDGKILLVRHHNPGAYDFWVTPGGGAVGDKDSSCNCQAWNLQGVQSAHCAGSRAVIEQFVQRGLPAKNVGQHWCAQALNASQTPES